MMRSLIYFLIIFFGFSLNLQASTLRAGASSAPYGYGNPLTTHISLNVLTTATLFDSLTSIAEDASVQPSLALSWKANNNLEWEFKLRPNVFFSNGEKMNSDAVIKTIEFLKSREAASYGLAKEVSKISKIKKIDEHTIQIITEKPDAILPKKLSLISILPPNAWKELGPEKFAEQPIGTGSFILEKWGKSEGKTVLFSNTTSWRPSKEIKKLEILYPLRDPGTRLAAIQSGDVDITLNLAFDDIPDVRDQGYTVLLQPVPQIRALVLPNYGKPGSPLNDVRVRRALNFAVDKQSIAEILYQGASKPAGQGAIQGTVGYNPNIKPYPFNPQKAIELLSEAGYSQGIKLNAEVEIGQAQVIYQKAAQDLAKVGVEMNVRTVVAAEWIRKYHSGDLGNADIISLVWHAGAYRDTIRAIESYSCAKPKPLFCEPSLMPAIEASGEIFDPKARDQVLQDIMASMHELAPSLFLINHTNIAVADPKIKNIILNERGLVFEEMEIIKPK